MPAITQLMIERNGKVVGVRNLYAQKSRGRRHIWRLSYRVSSKFLGNGFVFLEHPGFFLDNGHLSDVQAERIFQLMVPQADGSLALSFGQMTVGEYLEHLHDASFVLSRLLGPLMLRLRVSKDAQDESFPTLEELKEKIEQRGGSLVWENTLKFVNILIDHSISLGTIPPRDRWDELVSRASSDESSAKRQGPLPVVKVAVRDLVELVRSQTDKIDRLLTTIDALRVQVAELRQSGYPAPCPSDATLTTPVIPAGGLTVRPAAKVKPKPLVQRQSGPVSFEAELKGDVGALAEIAAIRDNT